MYNKMKDDTYPFYTAQQVESMKKYNCYYNACQTGNIELVKHLVEEEGFVNYDSGIWYACIGGHIEIVKFLLFKDKNIYTINFGFDYACQGGHIVELFISYGANEYLP